MRPTESKIDIRRKAIIDILNEEGQVRVAQLSERLGATVVTIRSDLQALEQDGYLERVAGGAVSATQNFFNRDFLRKKQENVEAKKKIAALAATLIQDGDTLFINSGTTNYFLSAELMRHKNLRIVTNSLINAVELANNPSFHVILLGGELNSTDSFTYGKDLMEQIQKYQAKYAFISVMGINENGVTTLHAQEALVDEMMMNQSEKTVVLADKSKMGIAGFVHLCGLDKINAVLTENEANLDVIKALTNKNIEVMMN